MAEIEVRGARVQLRPCRVKRSLLKQLRVLRAIPSEFRLALTDGEHAELQNPAITERRRDELNAKQSQLNPECTVGWIHGAVLGDEHTRYILFTKDGDVYLYSWPGFKPESWCKQLYVE